MKILIKPISSQNYIVTIAIGDMYYKNWEKFALPSWKIYCERYDIGLIIFTNDLISKDEKKWKKANWQKLLIGETLLKNGLKVNNVCYLDTDIIISPIAPDIFLNFDEESISMVSLRKNLPYDYNEVLRRIAFFRNLYYDETYPLDSALFISIHDLYKFHDLEPVDDESCTGFYIFNVEKKSKIMYDYFFKIDSNIVSITGGGEQTHFNHFLQTNTKIKWLEYKYQAIWVFELAWKYPFLYKLKDNHSDLINECINSSLLDNYFLHFAGSWHESKMWKNNNFEIGDNIYEIYRKYENYKKSPVYGDPIGVIKPKIHK
jgi:hypothetical protein